MPASQHFLHKKVKAESLHDTPFDPQQILAGPFKAAAEHTSIPESRLFFAQEF